MATDSCVLRSRNGSRALGGTSNGGGVGRSTSPSAPWIVVRPLIRCTILAFGRPRWLVYR